MGSWPPRAALTPAVAPPPTTPPIPQPPGGGLSPDTAYSVVIARDSLASYAEFLRIVPDGPLATRVRVLQALRREATIWQAAVASDDPRADWTYMRRYPRGPHRFDARRRLAALHAALEPPPRFDPFVFPALPPPTPAELPLVLAPEQELHGLPPIPPPPAALLPPADPAFYDELPMPTPAPAGLLPIAPPLPSAADGEPGRIRQTPPGRAAIVSESQVTPNGSASITLADSAGPVAELVASDAGDRRTLVETGPPLPEPIEAAPGKGDPAAGAKPPKAKSKTGPPVLSRTNVMRTAEGVTITQADGAGTGLLEIATTADADGARTTRVTNDRDEALASWRRNAQGVVVARQVAGQVPDQAAVVAGPAAAIVAAPPRSPLAMPNPPATKPAPRQVLSRRALRPWHHVPLRCRLPQWALRASPSPPRRLRGRRPVQPRLRLAVPHPFPFARPRRLPRRRRSCPRWRRRYPSPRRRPSRDRQRP